MVRTFAPALPVVLMHNKLNLTDQTVKINVTD
jgi:hypothetical protein